MRVICAVHACTQFFCWLLCYWQQIKKKNIILQKIQVMPAILVPRPQNRPFSTVKRSEKEEKNINLRFTYLKICFYIFLLCMYLLFCIIIWFDPMYRGLKFGISINLSENFEFFQIRNIKSLLIKYFIVYYYKVNDALQFEEKICPLAPIVF